MRGPQTRLRAAGLGPTRSTRPAGAGESLRLLENHLRFQGLQGLAKSSLPGLFPFISIAHSIDMHELTRPRIYFPRHLVFDRDQLLSGLELLEPRNNLQDIVPGLTHAAQTPGDDDLSLVGMDRVPEADRRRGRAEGDLPDPSRC